MEGAPVKTSGPASPGSIPTSRFWPGAAQNAGQTEHPPSKEPGSWRQHGHNLNSAAQEAMAEIFDEVPQVPMQGKGKDGKEGKDGKGGYSPWTGAGRAIAAKARSAWRSVASVPPGLGLPSAGNTAGAAQHGAQHGVPTAVPPGFLPPQVSSCASAPHASFSSKKLSSLRWHAVWCHERCHKTDAATLRAQLQLVISRYNGELICQKTAGKFKLWLDQERDEGGKGATEESFYILLSDWRQLKPCMDILQDP
eukprot:symbB.v1.2.039493.t1/scaffold6603.1/size28196/2